MPVVRWTPRRLPAPKSGIVPLFCPPGFSRRRPMAVKSGVVPGAR
ncbi:MAG: hypothetical protein AB7P40_22195 [Chloroflexota bacterium]